MKLYESLYILKRYTEIIEALTAIMIKHEYHRKGDREWSGHETIHYFTLYQNILMDVVSFLDEYEGSFVARSEPQFKDRILSVKRIAKPAVDEIKKWKGLESIRNEMIAHNWREKGTGDIIIPKIGSYDSPRNFHDLLYLQTYITIVMAVISAEFHEESLNVMPYIESLKNSESIAATSKPDFEQEIRKLVQTINVNCEEHGKPYSIDEEAIFMLKHED